MVVRSLRCKNVKININLENYIDVDELCFLNIEICEKITSYILRSNDLNCVITIYKHSLKSIHITGIKSASDMKNVISFLTIRLKNTITNITIDNSMFSCKLGRKINLHEVITNFKVSTHFCSFMEEIFPALFIKPNKENKYKGCPTIILFHNGSYVIIGAKSVKMVKLANIMLHKII